MNEIIIASFYKFVDLEDFEEMRAPLLAKMHELNIKGTIILAAEGINGSFAGHHEQMHFFYQFIHQDNRLNVVYGSFRVHAAIRYRLLLTKLLNYFYVLFLYRQGVLADFGS
jgi:predicted sulfurtransferase